MIDCGSDFRSSPGRLRDGSWGCLKAAIGSLHVCGRASPHQERWRQEDRGRGSHTSADSIELSNPADGASAKAEIAIAPHSNRTGNRLVFGPLGPSISLQFPSSRWSPKARVPGHGYQRRAFASCLTRGLHPAPRCLPSLLVRPMAGSPPISRDARREPIHRRLVDRQSSRSPSASENDFRVRSRRGTNMTAR